MQMITNPQELGATINELTLSAWTLAAIATLFESGLAEALAEPRSLDELAARVDALPRERIARVLDVVALRGFVTSKEGRYQLAPGVLPFAKPPMRNGLLGDLRSTILQVPAFVEAASHGTPTRGWHHTDPKLLQAQGDGSAQFAGGFAMNIVQHLGDLADRLAKPTARFLDVGVGVASLTIAMCRVFPQLRAVGLDVFDVPFGMARENVARAGLADRIELRQLAIEDLRDSEAFDLVWLPACFLSPSSIAAAIARARAALRPGGWILVPSLDSNAEPSYLAVFGMVMESWGTVTESELVMKHLVDAGFQPPRKLPGPSWVAPIAAQR
jgi:hypothetical protein